MNTIYIEKDRKCTLQEVQEIGERIMLNAGKSLDYDTLAKSIISGNTLRAFHRIDVNKSGPKEIINCFLINSKDSIINQLRKCKSAKDFDLLSNELEQTLKKELSKNVRPEILSNYNAVRKIVDLILEHVVLVSNELSNYRQQLIHFLRVPLDSFILNSSCLFTFNERKKFELTTNAGFLSIKKKEHYDSIQNHLASIANESKIDHPIYFDILWRDRINFKLNILE
jgi:hypothetical protein